jgi:hypothetical protein
VINKVDAIDDRAVLESYKRIARNDDPAQYLTHGYFVTRLAKSEQLGHQWAELRQVENEFFRDSQDWSDPDIRCGTTRLTKKLSDMLCDAISARLILKQR